MAISPSASAAATSSTALSTVRAASSIRPSALSARRTSDPSRRALMAWTAPTVAVAVAAPRAAASDIRSANAAVAPIAAEPQRRAA